MKIYLALSALLSHPEPALLEALAEIGAALDAEALVPRAARREVEALIGELSSGDLYDLQERYVSLFDRSRSLSLHLFEHVHGESRDRGQAMVDLLATYAKRGVRVADGELPDYLPAFLEFLSLSPADEAKGLLGEIADILRGVGDRLAERGSRYSAVFGALLAIAGEPGLAKKPAEGSSPTEDLTVLDREWKDPEVTFGGPQGGPQPVQFYPQEDARMSDFMHQLLFGIYPYVCLAVFLLGSLVRFEREQYTWKSDSSQMLRTGQLRWGSNLFHVGILMLFFGHLFGLLTPADLYHALGLSTEAKQMLAIGAGAIFGATCLAGLILLVHRRLAEPRIRATSTSMDIFILLWILATLLLGLVSIFFSLQHREGGVMLLLGQWAQHIATFRGGAADFIREVPWIYRVHLFFGLTMFLLFPFSRLVHVWSGFAAVGYLTRAYQIVRPRS